LSELHAPEPQISRVHALIFVCGLKYLLTYRDAKRRRVSHYLDDGLREAVEETLPALIQWSEEFQPPPLHGGRISFEWSPNLEFEQLTFGFEQLPTRLSAATSEWVRKTGDEASLLRLSFGMGVSARFGVRSQKFVQRMMEKPLSLSQSVIDVLESFHWHPEWSLALAR
jgi:hypothetical protein